MNFDKFGLADIALPSHNGFEYETTVRGRVAHIDSDFIAYMASAETRDEKDGLKPRKTFDEMCAKALSIADHYRRLAAAEHSVLHITPSGSNKGGRADQAVLLPYQGNRADSVKPEHLDGVRAFLGEQPNGRVHLDQEADDGMTQANLRAVAKGEKHLSVIVSKDKDLRMAPGLHWCFDEEVLIDVANSFGEIWLDRSKTATTLKGWGTKFFWAQMLMGDKADNISGLPKANGYTLHLLGVAKKPTQMHKQCGPVLTFDILDSLENDAQCWDVIKLLWSTCPGELLHHKTMLPVSWQHAMLGDAQLLWMRRSPDDTVMKWLREEVQTIYKKDK